MTSNAYVIEIFGIGSVIDDFSLHKDSSVRSMSCNMKAQYQKYWGDVTKLNHFLFIAVFLDPRRKWQYIKWVVEENFEKTSACSFLSNLDISLRILFEFYEESMPKKEKDFEVSTSSSSSRVWGDEGGVMDIEELMTKRFESAMGSSDISFRKTELDKYLGEDREPMNSRFDILQWWKVQQCRYPILAKMARDILSIPVSTVASESAFSTGGRVLDCFRTSLTPRMVEALVCGQDWLRDSNSAIHIQDTLLQIENTEAQGQQSIFIFIISVVFFNILFPYYVTDLKDLTSEQPSIMIDETIDESA